MERELDDRPVELIDLGAVTSETKGPPGPNIDSRGSLPAGMTNE